MQQCISFLTLIEISCPKSLNIFFKKIQTELSTAPDIISIPCKSGGAGLFIMDMMALLNRGSQYVSVSVFGS